jgi:hypothetical protein
MHRIMESPSSKSKPSRKICPTPHFWDSVPTPQEHQSKRWLRRLGALSATGRPYRPAPHRGVPTGQAPCRWADTDEGVS